MMARAFVTKTTTIATLHFICNIHSNKPIHSWDNYRVFIYVVGCLEMMRYNFRVPRLAAVSFLGAIVDYSLSPPIRLLVDAHFV